MTRGLMLFALFSVISLGEGTAQAKARPDWTVRKPADTASTLYFLGTATGEKKAKDAYNLALQRAIDGAVSWFGLTVTTGLRVEETEEGQQYGVEVKAVMQIEGREVPLKQIRVVNAHQESSWGDHRAWVLVAYPRAEAEATLALLDRGDTARAARAAALLRDSAAMLDAGRCDDAQEGFRRALDLVQSLNGLQPTGDAQFGTVQVVTAELRAGLARAQACLSQSWKTVAVKVLLRYDGQVAGDPLAGELQAAVSSRLAGHGFAAAATALDEAAVADILTGLPGAAARAGGAARADWLLLVVIEATFSSEIYGQFFAESSGRVEVIEAATGRKIWVDDLGAEKRGHVTRPKALNKAAGIQREPALAAVDQALAGIPRRETSVR